MTALFWLLFFICIITLISIDLFQDKRRGHQVMTFGLSMTWTLIWIGCALAFNVLIYFIYEYDLIDHAINSPLKGAEAALLFFTGYLIEKSLSLDNIFVIALIFSYFKIPPREQHRVLIWGVLGAIVMRFVMIFFGLALIQEFSWMNYVFGGLLILTALKMLTVKEHDVNPESNLIVRLAKRFFSVTDSIKGHAFFVKEKGKTLMTPLFLALIVVESTDLIFAIDSIPAILAITTDPVLIFTSNIFAILGLRSLYFALATAIDRFYFLRFSLIFLLAFIGIKMLLAHVYPIPTPISLGIIIAALMLGVAASIFIVDGKLASWAVPIQQQFKEIATVTIKDIKRIAILFAGLVILIAGIAMLVLPGPGLVFIPLGLMILAKEFLWAKALLKKLKDSNKTIKKFLETKEEDKDKKE